MREYVLDICCHAMDTFITLERGDPLLNLITLTIALQELVAKQCEVLVVIVQK